MDPLQLCSMPEWLKRVRGRRLVGTSTLCSDCGSRLAWLLGSVTSRDLSCQEQLTWTARRAVVFGDALRHHHQLSWFWAHPTIRIAMRSAALLRYCTAIPLRSAQPPSPTRRRNVFGVFWPSCPEDGRYVYVLTAVVTALGWETARIATELSITKEVLALKSSISARPASVESSLPVRLNRSYCGCNVRSTKLRRAPRVWSNPHAC